ncbi:DNA photolyase family protein [Paracrocinitomix mangrovi]|uniref:cryptochrome/photolyase family protein n=1 Tax=Paracrocinitomix mangrovi TaxID=2862509 RepID=UPI001C8DA27D|nr:deoxyribodipyrimidine photo-lyase [Paracrocinitomix mangrovi]UKN03115.1 DNA photolyase family protein [Paracrocinitomix mangrovi]
MKVNVFWFRRDLRLEDNVGLNAALGKGFPVLPIFIFDENILDELPADDSRVNFIYDQLKSINATLGNYNSALKVYHGDPFEIWKNVLNEYDIAEVFTNRDYEPYALKRDKNVEEILNEHGVRMVTFKDQVIFEKEEVLKDDGTPYTVFTPFMKKWRSQFNYNALHFTEDVEFNRFLPLNIPFPSKSDLGIKPSKIKVASYNPKALNGYAENRNLPEIDTSNLGPHLRFGTISIRKLIKEVYKNHWQFTNELIWREFFMMILYHFPKSVEFNFKSKYDGIAWRNNEAEFEQWCRGETGYPMVDAGMRQLNETGYMHGRVRMVCASFLCKHLLIDWRWGEAYFAEKLLDYELSSNIGNWQWVAGTGCDAAPYFRIFNPHEQLKKFDPKLKYVKTWVKDFEDLTYPQEMVSHKEARERCLQTYKVGIEVVEKVN